MTNAEKEAAALAEHKTHWQLALDYNQPAELRAYHQRMQHKAMATLTCCWAETYARKSEEDLIKKIFCPTAANRVLSWHDKQILGLIQ